MLPEMPASGLPAYRIRVSRRARQVRLRVSIHEGVVVIVPQGFNLGCLPALLERRKPWLAKTLAKFRQQPVRLAAEPLPAVMTLNALGQRWTVDYQFAASIITIFTEESYLLVVQGHIQNQRGCREALRRWLVRHAHAT